MLDLADFALQEQAEDNLMLAISSQAWYIGLYTMAAEPIKSLELLYTMLQFLIVGVVIQHIVTCALSKYGQGALNIRLLCTTDNDIMRYT